MAKNNTRESFIGVRLSENEYDIIKNAAETEDRSMGSFMRIASLERAESANDE